MRGWMIVCVGFVAACGGAMAPQHSVAFPEFHRKLTNGITLVVVPDATSSLVEVAVRYDVGSREDPPGKAGLAHLVEHLMFQQRQAGPDKPPIRAVFRDYAVYTNAYTNWDSTHYHTRARAERAVDLVALEISRLETGCQTIDPETFAREREVVRNEIRTVLGTPEAQVGYLLLEAVYPPGHPYRQHVGGDDEQLASITLDDVCKFMRDYYVPERAAFIVTGGVDANVEARLLPMLGPVPARKGAPRAVVPPIKLTSETVQREFDVEETSVFAAWALPPQSTDEWQAAMDYVGELTYRAAIFGDIYEFATDVSVQVIGGAEAPALVVQVSVVSPDQVSEATAALRRAANGLRRRWFDATELRNHRARLSGAALYQLDGLTARADAFADFAQFRGYKYTMGDEVERAQRYDPERTSAVGREILDPDKAKLLVMSPKKGAPPRLRRAALTYAASTSEPDELAVDRAEAAHAVAVPAEPVATASATSFTLENGMRVVLLPSRLQLPLVTLALSFRSGTAQDPADRGGLARAALDHMFSPLGDYELAYVGAGRGSSIDADSTVFYVRGLSPYIDKLLLGLERRVAIGNYSQNAEEGWARRMKFALRRPSVRSEQAFGQIWRRAVFGDHPYARNGEATVSSVNEIGHDALLAFRDRHYVARNATLVVAGSFDAAHATALIRARFGDFREGSAVAGPPPVSAKAAGARFVGVVGEHMEMVPVAVAYRVDTPLDKDYAARLVVAEMLSNRVRVVRDKMGASYGIYGSLLTLDGAGAYVIGGSVDPERGGESLRKLREAVATLRSGEGFVEEFVRARRRVLEARLAVASNTSELARRAVWNDRYGRPIEFENTLVSEIAKLTPKAVMVVMGAELAPDREVVVLLGKQPVLVKTFAQAGIDSAQIMKEP